MEARGRLAVDRRRHESRVYPSVELGERRQLPAVSVHAVHDGAEDLRAAGHPPQRAARAAERGHHPPHGALRLPAGRAERVPGQHRLHRRAQDTGGRGQGGALLPRQVLLRSVSPVSKDEDDDDGDDDDDDGDDDDDHDDSSEDGGWLSMWRDIKRTVTHPPTSS